jgi:multiple sugar transport system substrate-binding protein
MAEGIVFKGGHFREEPNMVTMLGMFARCITGIALTVLLLAGGAGAAAAQSGSITIWVGSWWEPQVPIAKELWAKDHPDITLDIQPLPINGYLDKFTTTALGGAAPDVIDLDTTWVSTVAAHGLLQPLDDIVDKLPVADISPAAWKASQYKGVQYAIPNRSGPGVYYYNKTVFDKAGVPYPKEDWTYADFLEIAKKLTIPGEQYGVGVPADVSDPSNVTTMFAPMLWAMGGDFLSADGTKPLINSPESVKAITFWSDLYLKYKVTPEGTPNFTTTRDIQPLFEANKVGMLTASSNAFDEFSKFKDLKWGMVLSPEKVNRGGGWTMGVPEGAKNTEGAKTFLLWLSQPEIMAKVMNRFPSNRKALALPPWNDPAKAIFTQAEAGGRSVPSVAGWFQMQEALIVELQKILVGQSTPQQAADAAAAKMSQIIAENQ